MSAQGSGGKLAPIPLNQAVVVLDLTAASQKYNVLGSCGVIYAGAGMRMRAVAVQISPKVEDGDVYPAPSGQGKVALAKNGLLKIASAHGIIWDPVGSKMMSDAPPCIACVETGQRLGRPPFCAHNMGFKAVGAWLNAMGQWEVHCATRYWSWDEELAEVQRVYRKQLRDGKITEAEFDSRVQDEFQKRFRDRFTLVETKAMLRVVRQLGLKAAYLPGELAKPFLAVHVEPDISIEEARRRGMLSAREIFGAEMQLPGLPAGLPAPDFSRATEAAAGAEDENGNSGEPAGGASTDEAAEEQSPPDGAQSELPAGGSGVVCDWQGCGEVLTDRIVAYCQGPVGQKKFSGKSYCWKHQGMAGAGVKGGGA